MFLYILVVNKVTSRSHTLSGHKLTVTAHYECLGTAISTEGPVPVIPKPIPYSVDKELMKHVMDKHVALLAEEMQKVNAQVTWPYNGDTTKALLNPVASDSHDRNMWSKWPTTTTAQLSSFLQKFVTEPIDVPPNIWADITDMIPELKLGDVDVHERGNKSVIELVGISSSVVQAKENLVKSVEELKLKAEREAETVTKKLKLSPLKLKLFTMFAIHEELNKLHPEVQITVSADTNEIFFRGVRGEISESQVVMYGVFEALTIHTFETSTDMFHFIEKSCEIVNGVLASKSIAAICNVADAKISVYGKIHNDTERAMKILQTDIKCKTMPIESDATLQALCSKLGKEKLRALDDSGLVITHLDSGKRQMTVTGFIENVDDTIGQIGKFLDENVIIEKLIPFSPLHIKYLQEKCGKELSDIRNRNPDVKLSGEIKGKRSGFMMKGNEKGLNAVGTMIVNLKSKLIERKHKVDKPGMPELLQDQKGQRVLQSVAHECDCLISTENLAEQGDEDTSSSSTGQPRTLCHVTTSQGYRLVVCNGDLTKEKADAIVNAANTALNHIGGLAKAIAVAGKIAYLFRFNEEYIMIMYDTFTW